MERAGKIGVEQMTDKKSFLPAGKNLGKNEKEVKIIRREIVAILNWVATNKDDVILDKCLKMKSFPTFVECVIFFSYRDKTPPILSTGWADQPRVYYFRKAWDELKLPPFERSCFHD